MDLVIIKLTLTNNKFVYKFISVDFGLLICDSTNKPVLAHRHNYNMFLNKPSYIQYNHIGCLMLLNLFHFQLYPRLNWLPQFPQPR